MSSTIQVTSLGITLIVFWRQCNVLCSWIYIRPQKSVNEIDRDMGKATPGLQTIDFLFNELQHMLKN